MGWIKSDISSIALQFHFLSIVTSRQVFPGLILGVRPSNERWRYFATSSLSLSLAGGGLILGVCPANEKQCYFVTTSLVGWAQA